MRPSRDSRFIRLLLTLFFLLAGGYALYEAQGLVYGPSIELEHTATSSDTAFTSIKGHVERISELRLNGNTISVTEDGEFDEPYLLADGSNRIILEARDARGRTTSATLDIVYRAPEGSYVPGASHATSSPATSTPSTPL
ncbi:hypothetical protein JNK62_02210 [bacterium]|nr:hypothetical protein [bacterium]